MPASMCEGIINKAERTDSPLFPQCSKEIMGASHSDFRDVERTVRKHLQRDFTHHTALCSYSSHWQVPINGGQRLHPAPSAASSFDTCTWISCSHLKVTNTNWNHHLPRLNPLHFPLSFCWDCWTPLTSSSNLETLFSVQSINKSCWPHICLDPSPPLHPHDPSWISPGCS